MHVGVCVCVSMCVQGVCVSVQAGRVCVGVWTSQDKYACRCLCVRVYVYVCMAVCAGAWVQVCMYMPVHVCTGTYVCSDVW